MNRTLNTILHRPKSFFLPDTLTHQWLCHQCLAIASDCSKNQKPIRSLLELLSYRQQYRQYSKRYHKGKDDEKHRIEPQQYPKNGVRDALRKDIPTDFGILPGTLVMPTGSNRPGITSAPTLIMKLEFQRLKARIMNTFKLLLYKWSMGSRVKLHLRRTAPTAAALHRRLFTAFAEGDRATISSIACSHLELELSHHINSMSPNSKYLWTLHRYISPPRVVSHQVSRLPIDDGPEAASYARQAIVQIQSVQSLKQVDSPSSREKIGLLSDENELPQKKLTEYIVIQKRTLKGIEEKDWRIWGFVQETPINGENQKSIIHSNTSAPSTL